MKSKLLSLFLLTAILSVAMISAAVSFDISPVKISFLESKLSANFTITNTGADSNFSIPTTTISDGTNTAVVTFSETNFEILSGANKVITASVDSTALSNLEFGTHPVNTIITATNGTDSSTKTLTLEAAKSFCEFGDKGDLDIKGVDFTVDGFGDDNEWYLTDEVTVDVDVKNTGDDDVDNVVLAWQLFDKDTGEIIIDDEENDIDIKDGDTETFTFTFTVDPDDFDSDTVGDKFAFMVKAYSDDQGEDLQCGSKEENVKLMIDNDFVILTNIQFTETAPCGEISELTAEIWNIGDDDQQDVSVRVVNTELGINELVDAGDIDSLESKKLRADIKIPANAKEKSYDLKLAVLDEDSDVFENDNNDASEYNLILKVEGNCQTTTSGASALISAELDPETPSAVPGKQVIINANLKNAGTSETTYTLSVIGNSEWSSLSAIDPQTITLAAGESKDVSIYLDIDDDATGEKEFTIRASYDGKTTEQKVALALESGASQDVILTHLKNNWFIYVIVIVNIILIIAIIMVVKSMVSRPSR
ncbi:MAG: putative S-layer protein [Candidatus Nanoarchaeia archaeon]|nr:putative S-layer protein [Candidatus Nanoarchaeia archaeon]MDD5740882.1 putative S-layer protein [Candidatus Nanoarchaeia archaeon]